MGKYGFDFQVQVELPADATAQLEAAAEKALKKVASELTGRFDDAITSAYWVWPRPSKRGTQAGTLEATAKRWAKAGFNVNSPRNIVDSSALKDSRDFSSSGLTAEWVWTTDYAAAVHDGAWIYPWANQKASKVLLPARPWTDAVLEGHPHYSGPIYPFSERLAEEIEKAAG